MQSLKNKNILVTGAFGFIGSHLVDKLIEEEPNRIIASGTCFLGKKENLKQANDFSNVEVLEADVSNPREVRSIFKNNKIEVVFNLAVVPLPASLIKPAYVFQKNVNITLNLCEAVREKRKQNKNVTLIHFSSSETYGTAKYIPMDENHQLEPTTPYAASKAASDQLVLSYYRTFNIDAAILRPFNNYGPRQNAGKYAGLIPLTIGRIIKEKDIIINGDGNQTRDWIYVEDTAKAAIDTYKHESQPVAK